MSRSIALAVCLFGFAGILVFLPREAGAATFTVTKTQDTNDGSCDASDCSLREAVASANSASGADTISLPAGEYFLTMGEIEVTSNLTLTGAGASSTIIDGINNTNRIFRLLGDTRFLSVSISNVTLKNATAMPLSSGEVPVGGCIWNDSNNSLTLTNATLQDCAADFGGCVMSEGPLTVIDSTFSGCEAVEYGGAIDARGSASDPGIVIDVAVNISGSTFTNNESEESGGAILTQEVESIEITDTVFSGNSAWHVGGAIDFVDNTHTGTVTITGSTFSDNTVTAEGGGSGNGGAIQANTTLVISDTTFENNTAQSYGGALYNEYDEEESPTTTSTITSSIFTGNIAGSHGAAIVNVRHARLEIVSSSLIGNEIDADNGDGGGIYCDDPEAVLTIRNSAIVSNRAGTNGQGGGLQNNGCAVTITNSTFTKNSAIYGGAIRSSIYSQESPGNASITIRNSTISKNTASYGGGLVVEEGSTLSIQSSILSGNSATISQNDFVGTLASLGFNLFSYEVKETVVSRSNDVFADDPGLGDFVDTGEAGGGYFPLAQGSAALDTGSCDEEDLETDQLGNSRESECDIGAIEGGGSQSDIGTESGSKSSGESGGGCSLGKEASSQNQLFLFIPLFLFFGFILRVKNNLSVKT